MFLIAKVFVQVAFKNLFNALLKEAVEKGMELFLAFKLFEEILWNG
jgi:hypothetical protein